MPNKPEPKVTLGDETRADKLSKSPRSRGGVHWSDYSWSKKMSQGPDAGEIPSPVATNKLVHTLQEKSQN